MKSIFMVLIASLLLVSCNQHAEKHSTNTKYLVTNPIILDTLITKDYVCQIHATKHIELRALEKGYLQQIFVDEGQWVQKGQLMFKIMPNLYEAELSKAKAEAELAEIEYNNTRLLADSHIVSTNELAMANARFNKAKAEVALASAHLEFTNVRAPFDGIMDHLHVREGSLLDEGELLTTLSDNSKMWVYFNVPETEYLEYVENHKVGTRPTVRLMLANNREFNQTGVVETIEGEFNNETGNIAFRATFPNPNQLLRHGETGSILMDVPLENVLIIPQKATFEVLDKKYVFVIDKNQTVQQREIKISAELPHLFAVSKGLKTEDKILLEGLRLVKAGDRIDFELAHPEKVMANLELYAE